MGREGKATWSNDRTKFNLYHVWLGWDVRPLAHLSYDRIFVIVNGNSYGNMICYKTDAPVCVAEIIISVHRNNTYISHIIIAG